MVKSKKNILKIGKPEKTLTLKGIVDKKSPPAYIKIDGHIYEKLEIKTAPIGLDFDDDTFSILKDVVKKGGYVNHQEAIRDAIRKMIK